MACEDSVPSFKVQTWEDMESSLERFMSCVAILFQSDDGEVSILLACSSLD